MNGIKLILDLTNKTGFLLPPLAEIEVTILKVLREKGITGTIEIGLEIVDRADIQRLNAKYRGKDTPTDVLSFPIFEKVPLANLETTLIGDVVICDEVLVENARLYGVEPMEEFKNLVAHSVLHLLGYHHKGD